MKNRSNIRTDLAVEARELWNESADRKTALKGVEARDGMTEGYKTTVVKILDENGERELGGALAVTSNPMTHNVTK
jgi:spore protease